MSASVPRCGRLDAHEAHGWTRPALGNLAGPPLPAATYQCPGAPHIEGGYFLDPEWLEHVAEQNANYWEGSE